MSKQNTILGILIVVILVLAGYAFWPRSQVAGSSAVGTTNTTPRIAETVCNNLGSTTIASFYNGDGSDRVITSVDLVTIPAATTSLNAVWAATSTQASGIGASTNYLLNITFATTTSPVYIVSSTASSSAVTTATSTALTTGTGWLTGSPQRIWASGSYFNVISNATSTDYCNVKVAYIPE